MKRLAHGTEIADQPRHLRSGQPPRAGKLAGIKSHQAGPPPPRRRKCRLLQSDASRERSDRSPLYVLVFQRLRFRLHTQQAGQIHSSCITLRLPWLREERSYSGGREGRQIVIEVERVSSHRIHEGSFGGARAGDLYPRSSPSLPPPMAPAIGLHVRQRARSIPPRHNPACRSDRPAPAPGRLPEAPIYRTVRRSRRKHASAHPASQRVARNSSVIMSQTRLRQRGLKLFNAASVEGCSPCA